MNENKGNYMTIKELKEIIKDILIKLILPLYK